MKETPRYLYPLQTKRTGDKRADVGRKMADVTESIARKKQSVKKNYEKYGSHKYIWKGTLDRLMGVPFNIDGLTKADAISYYYGYYERGKRLLDISKNQGFIKYEYNEFGIKKIYYVSKEDFEEALKKITINDEMNNEIDDLNYINGEIESSSKKRIKKMEVYNG